MAKTWLTTREAAELLELPTWYIYREARAGRLKAEIIEREPLPKKTKARPSIRIYPDEFVAYVEKYWPRFVDRVRAA